MNENIMRSLGFGDAVAKKKEGICPFCNKKVDIDSFKDELSKKEFGISGLCQSCQDKVFKEDD